jgi:hypothetical protein
MPYLKAPIHSRGPLVNLRIEVSSPRAGALRMARQPVPQAINLQGLIDCGADVTFIDTHHLPFLAYQKPAIRLVGDGAGGWTIGLEYDVSLTVLHPGGRRSNLLLPSIAIVDKMLHAALGYEALVGRDVLDRCLFVYDGQDRTYTLGY